MMKLHGMKWAMAALFCTLAAAAALPTRATAQVYRCTLSDGTISLGDRPCAVGVPGEPVKGLPGVPVPAESGARPQSNGSTQCERWSQRTSRYGDGDGGYRSAASVRYAADRHQQDCHGYKTKATAGDKSREAAVQREFADQGCDIKHRAVKDGYQKRAGFNDVDRRAFDRLAADVARDC